MMSVYFVVSQVISRFRIAAPLPCAKLRDAVWAWPGLNRADDKDAMLIARLVAQLHCYAPERAELGPGQPPAFMRALGEREDWTDLRVYGALLAVGTELFSRPGVHYLSGFYGPIERALRDMGANVEFAPADFRRLGPLLERQSPRVMTLQSRIVPWFGPGAVITTPRHQVDVIVTEYGAAELEGLTVRERGEALAAIAHPQFRGELLAAAERASKGRSPVA
jgi:hypothetical protein